MPELPEVETWRRLAERRLAGRRIVDAVVAEDPIVLAGASAASVSEALAGRRVVSAHRKGKHLWLALDVRPWPAMHFGMAGGLHDVAPGAPRPRFWKLDLRTAEGTRVVMTDARRLGRIRLRADPAAEHPIALLGFDVMNELPPPAALHRAIAARRAPLKAVLLDQTVFAGVGNWIADEVLYRARLHPARVAASLSLEESGRLRRALAEVIRRAVDVGADSDRFPRGWLFHRRWGRDPEAVTQRGEPLRFSTIGGRTTAWVPAVQGWGPRGKTGTTRAAGAKTKRGR